MNARTAPGVRALGRRLLPLDSPEREMTVAGRRGGDRRTREKKIVIMTEALGSVWADVTWYHDGKSRERFCYQLVPGSAGLQIAVLTPMTPVP